jgi:hypothetical protein
VSRHPLLVETRPSSSIDLDDLEHVRAWIRSEVERDRAAMPADPALWFLFEDRVESVRVPTASDRGRVLSFAYQSLSGRAGVRHAVWVGDARLATDGGYRRAICALEVGRDGWWATWRFVRYDDALGESVPMGPWHERCGGPEDPLESPFDAWVGPADLARRSHGVDVRVGSGELPIELPDRPDALVDLVAGLLYGQIAIEGGLDCDVVVAFAGRSFEIWEVRGRLPVSFDDLVRAIGARGSADALAVLSRGPDVDDARIVTTSAEVGGTRAAHRMVLELDHHRVVRSRIEDLPNGSARWLGVPPETDIALEPSRAEGWGAVTAEG